ncbi:MAG: ATP-binding protein [Bacteroidia bacterium]
MKKLIGREKELEKLQRALSSNKSEFVALFGRRRVGKTFLVRSFFKNSFSFHLTGLANANTAQQLTNFFTAILRQTSLQIQDAPKNWFQAFQILIDLLEADQRSGKKVVFLDELPWLDTPRSDFIMALEHFWNSWASTRDDILLVTCGSAASWMINNLINNHGGLHNRVTQRIRVEPFSLAETELLLIENGCRLDHYQIIQLYMVMGGIPFYLEQVVPGKSAAQNIEEMCFSKDGLLVSEFDNLFNSLFRSAENYEKIIQLLATKEKGMTRSELASGKELSSGGRLSKYLKELEESGFISRFPVFGKKKRDFVYRLTDFYSLFYLKFIQKNTNYSQGFWLSGLDLPERRVWSGRAYEQVCMTHIPQIKRALGISAVLTEHSTWQGKSSGQGAQIDLLIDRRDRVINICEIKFSMNPFTITNSYSENLRNKLGVFREVSQTRKSLFLTFITTFGIKENIHSNSLVQNSVTMEAFFS